MKAKTLLLLVLTILVSSTAMAQNAVKIGHVNVQELVQKHPSMDSIKTILENESKDMEEIYTEMLGEHETKLKTFEAESSGYSDFVKQAKQTELIELAQKIQNYNQTAQQHMQKRNTELVQPVYQNINQEISNVAGYGKFSYILDISAGGVAYIAPDSEDITPKVLERLAAK